MIRHPRAATSRARRPPRRRHPRRPRLDAKRRTRRAGRAFEPEQAPTIARVLQLLAAAAPDLGRWLSLGLALLTVAMLQLWRGARSGNGGLTLCALSRTLPLDEPEKARSKRLYRLLRNASLDGTELTPLLVRLALGDTPRGWIPIVVDQTTVCGTQVIMAGVRVAHRILPVAFVCYEYDEIRKSQNLIEYSLLLLIASCLPPGCKPVFVMDRGYARASLLTQLRTLNIPFVVRGRSNTIVRVGGQRRSLGRLPGRAGRARRYVNAAYQDTTQEPVDVVVFHNPAFQEPWFLLVPAGLSIAYLLAVLLGSGQIAARVRAHTEVLRSTPRHGTRRRLSALSIGILALSLRRFVGLATHELDRLLAGFERGVPAAEIIR